MLENITTTGLVDIRTISVEPSLPKPEKVNNFITQIDDPYHFKWKHLTITADFDPNGPTIEECLQGLVFPC